MSEYPVGIVGIDDSRYPLLLKQIPNPPKTLHYKGVWKKEIFGSCLGVVGSRRMTTYGRKVTESLVFELACNGLVVVSGFMYGIDATAHKVALDAGGITIAVMPCGVDVVHPAYQQDLYDRLLFSGGLILSEYENGQVPRKWHYPERNRIVSGLSQGVLIIEAARNSGSLITAGLAKEYERHVFAVSGNIDSVTSEGTLDLVGEGAYMVRKSLDVLQVLGVVGFSGKFTGKNSVSEVGNDSSSDVLNASAKKLVPKKVGEMVLALISNEPMTVDELSRATEATSGALGNELTLLMLSGAIFEENGKYYAS